MDNIFTGVYIDDFTYEAIPACPKLTGLNVTQVGPDSVVIAFNPSGTVATGYEWGPVGFAQGTGTIGVANSGSPVTISGLTSGTAYDIYLRNDCSGGGNGTSVWTGPITFITTCLTQSLPYSENFDANMGCMLPFNLGATAEGWEHQPAGGSNKFGDLDGTPYLIADSDFHANGLHMICALESPPIDTAGLGSGVLLLEYDQFYNSIGGDSATVQVWDGTNWVDVSVQTTDAGAFGNPDHQALDVTAYANGNFKFRFLYDDNNIWAWYWAIDNVSLRVVTCSEPTDITANATATTALVTWNSTSGAGDHVVEWGLTGYTQGTGQIGSIAVTDTFHTITGLTANTTYDVYVMDSCGVNGNSLYVGPITFTTGCAITPANLPINDGFESYATGSFLGAANFCNPTHFWEFKGSNANGQLRFDAGYSNTGTQAATLDYSGFIFPAEKSDLMWHVDLSNYTTAIGIELSFSFNSHGAATDPNHRVWVKGDLADPWIEIVNLDALKQSGVYVDVKNIDIVSILGGAGQSVSANTQFKFGVVATGNAFSMTCCNGFSFDDVVLEEVTCPTPTNLAISGVLDTAATLTWNNNAAVNTGHQVWFGPQGFWQGSKYYRWGCYFCQLKQPSCRYP